MMKKTIRNILMTMLAAGLLAGLCGCGRQPETKETPETAAATETATGTAAPSGEPARQTRTGFYLDTVITLSAYTDRPELLDEGLELCAAYEKMLSRTIEGSDVWKINHAEGETVTVSPETAELLRAAAEAGELSGGAFDLTIAPASTLWDFRSGEKKIPSAQALAEAAKLVDYRKIRIEGNNVTLPAGMMIDLGGIAKGYIADAVKNSLAEKGIGSAILSFGGNIVAIGMKPDGSPWKVGIQDIDEPTGKIMMTSLNFGGSTVTSGIYERGFEADGVTYHHILDSKTGWPVQNELASVTIFSESSMWGDALSTAAFALGTEAGGRLIESIDGAEALFIARDRSAYGTSGIGKYIAEGSYTPLPQAEPAKATEAEQAEAEAERTDAVEAEGTDAAEAAPEETLVLTARVRESDPAPGYILVQCAGIAGFLALPEAGEKTQVILQRLDDGTEWRNVIRMTPEGFCMTEANCEGHDCIEEGEVTLANRQERILENMVLCLPHQLMLNLYSPEEAAELSERLAGNGGE